MILDIDHLALCLDSYDEGNNFLSSIGYKCTYSIKEENNFKIKKPFLEKFSNTHDFALYNLENSFGIEIINHKNCVNKKARIIPKFENNNFNINKYSKKIRELLSDNIKREKTNSDEKTIFNKIIFKTNNIIQSKKFWMCLGFSKINENILEFSSIFNKKKYQIILEEDKKNSDLKLDYCGFNCIAFISNSIEEERIKLQKENYFVSDIEEISIKEKKLNLFFCRGPANEIIEIISPKIS